MNILIVEDSPFCMELLNAILQRAGHDTVQASNGLEAMGKLVDDSFDLIISDVFMPEMDGRELYRCLKDNSHVADTPFVFASNAADASVIMEIGRLGCRHFLVKPLKKERVLAKIKDIYPAQRTYLKNHHVVMHDMELDALTYKGFAEEYLEAVNRFSRLLEEGAEWSAMQLCVTQIHEGAEILGTDQLIEILNGYLYNQTAMLEEIAFEIDEFLRADIVRVLDKVSKEVGVQTAPTEEPAVSPQETAAEVLLEEKKTAQEPEPKTIDAAPVKQELQPPVPAPAPAAAIPKKDFSRPVSWAAKEQAFKKKLEQAIKGDQDAQYAVALAYLHGEGVEENAGLAKDWFAKVAAKGHAEALCEMGLAEVGASEKPTEPQKLRALDFFKKAVERGSQESKFWRDQVKEMIGKETVSPETNAMALRAKADAGDMISQYRLGLLYHRGEDIPRNIPSATYWLRRAASHGHTLAQFRLASIYESGQAGQESLPEAIQWFEQSAEQGHMESLYSVGRCYHLGIGVKPDHTYAKIWYERAAMKGYRNALFSLGLLAEDNKGIVQDRVEAMKWYLACRESGSNLANKKIAELSDKLGRHEIEQAQEDAYRILESFSPKKT